MQLNKDDKILETEKTKKSNISLKIIHLYPEEMNIYGDMGNIITLQNRISRRGISVDLQSIGKGALPTALDADIYFMGGGQDNDMYHVYQDFITYKKEQIISEVEKNKVFLLICGAFQLFGKSFLDASGRNIAGLDILPVETKAPGDALKDRCLGNLIVKPSDKMQALIKENYPEVNSTKRADNLKIVGFENHSGQTFLIENHPNFDVSQPVGTVLKGRGNNAYDGVEGVIYNNIFGSYCHGSLLPKNPHYADTLISLALKNKYPNIQLSPLDDSLEWEAHDSVLKIYG